MLAVAAWEFPTTVAAVLVALGVIGKAIHWAYKVFSRMDESLGYVRDEMTYNGGSTMRDAVRRIEGRLDRIEANQADVAAELQTFRRHSTATGRAVREDVATLLEHDDERDIPGKRYEPQENPS